MNRNEMKTSVGIMPKEKEQHSFFVTVLIRLLKEKPLGTAGGVIVLLLLLTGIFCNFLAPYPYAEAHPVDSLTPPSAHYLLGTDNLGRDMLSRILWGARVSMIVGLACSLVTLLVAVLIGLPSGYFGGKYDMVMQRFIDAWMCFPGILITLVVMTIVGPGLLQVIFVIGIFSGFTNSRIVRSVVIGIKESLYIMAGRAIGCNSRQLLISHVLPNIAAPLIIIFTLGVGQAILIEAIISFLGFGIPPPLPTWGGLLSGPARQYMLQAPWMAIWPGLALSLVVWGINMLGDALRDILDPKLRGGVGRYGLTKTNIKAKMATL
jgi:peptide/nickel transport system permease protein